MSEPTREALRSEIENGPLKDELAPFWNDVFPVEPEPPDAPHPGPHPREQAEAESTPEAVAAWESAERAFQTRKRWERIRLRAGILKPDPAFEIHKILTERGRADELGWGRDWSYELVIAAKGKTPKEVMPPGPPPLPPLSRTPGVPSGFRPEAMVKVTAPEGFPETTVRFHRLRAELSVQSDRGAAIMAAAYVDEALTRAIKLRLRDLRLPKDSSVFNRLFEGNGPLQNFSARIDLAFSLQLIGEHSYSDLTYIRKIRNAFAHWLDLDSAEEGLTFQTNKIRDWCDNLWIPKNDYYARHGAEWLKDADLDHGRGRYVFSVFQIIRLIEVAADHWAILDKRTDKRGLRLV